MLRNENESISNAEKKASNVTHSLHERLNHLQVVDVTELSIVEYSAIILYRLSG